MSEYSTWKDHLLSKVYSVLLGSKQFCQVE